ncbi:MAG: response regulator [Ktedonobacteraceae bacterium]
MQQHKKKILIADDDPAILDVLMLFLEDAGYAVETTTNGETLRDFPNGYPDLLLLDIWMSGWNGQDICLALKSQEATRHLPILIVSANRETKHMACRAGADDFLAKPFDLDDLLKKIEHFL